MEITESNFNDYFRDIKKHERQDGDVIVSYRSRIEFQDSDLKRDVIRLLTQVDNGSRLAVEAVCLYAAASRRDAIRLCAEIMVDLAGGMAPEKSAQKSYLYEIVLFFYTKPEHLPTAWLEEKNSAWAVVPDEIAKSIDI